MSAEVDLLRRAAALIRERAEAATPGRWVVFDMDDGLSADERVNDVDGWWWVWAEDRLPNYGGVLDPDPHSANCTNRAETCCRVVVGTAGITDGSEPAKERADAEHIASWHPGMALAVADWLEDVAKDWDENTTIDSPEVGDYMPPAPEATWCDWCGGAIDSEHYSTADQRCDCYRWPRALAVARTYLGEQS